MTNPGIYNRKYFSITPIAGVSGTFGKVECPRNSDTIIVSVKAGALDLWFGEFTGSSAPLCPHLHFGQANWPQEIPIPEGVTTVSYRTAGDQVNPNIACLMIGQR